MYVSLIHIPFMSQIGVVELHTIHHFCGSGLSVFPFRDLLPSVE